MTRRRPLLHLVLLVLLLLAVPGHLVDLNCMLAGSACHECMAGAPDCSAHSSPAADAGAKVLPPVAIVLLEPTPPRPPRLRPCEDARLAPPSAPPPRCTGLRAPPV